MSMLIVVILIVLLFAVPPMASVMRLEVFGYLLALKPTDYDGWTHFGKLLREKKHYQRAHFALKQALSIQPNYTEAWYQLSEVYREIEMHDKADEALARAIDAEVSRIK